MKPRYKFLIWVIVLLVGVWLLIIGCTDLDWMVNGYRWDMWNGSDAANGIWWFNTHWGMEWWNAYMFTLWRIIIGTTLLTGSIMYAALKGVGKNET